MGTLVSHVSVNAFFDAARGDGRATSDDRLGMGLIRENFKNGLMQDLSTTAIALNKTWYPHLDWNDAAAMTAGSTLHLSSHQKPRAILYYSFPPTMGADEKLWLEIDGAPKMPNEDRVFMSRLYFYLRTDSEFLRMGHVVCAQELAGKKVEPRANDQLEEYYEYGAKISTLLAGWLKDSFSDKSFLQAAQRNALLLLGHQAKHPQAQKASYMFPPIPKAV